VVSGVTKILLQKSDLVKGPKSMLAGRLDLLAAAAAPVLVVTLGEHEYSLVTTLRDCLSGTSLKAEPLAKVLRLAPALRTSLHELWSSAAKILDSTSVHLLEPC